MAKIILRQEAIDDLNNITSSNRHHDGGMRLFDDNYLDRDSDNLNESHDYFMKGK